MGRGESCLGGVHACRENRGNPELIIVLYRIVSYRISRPHRLGVQLKEPLGITNKHVGYIYLVDSQAKIRWAGCGFATPEEREALRRGVAVLLGRAKEGR